MSTARLNSAIRLCKSINGKRDWRLAGGGAAAWLRRIVQFGQSGFGVFRTDLNVFGAAPFESTPEGTDFKVMAVARSMKEVIIALHCGFGINTVGFAVYNYQVPLLYQSFAPSS